MKLSKVTITGIDERTDVKRLERLQEKYPFVEWGVLLSSHWNENGNRFPRPRFLEKLQYHGLQLSAHLCGQIAKDVLHCELGPMFEAIEYNFDIFSRCQLNIRNPKQFFYDLRSMRPFDRIIEEVILQMPDVPTLESFIQFVGKPTPRVAYLIDGSGGCGIDTPIDVFADPALHIGYAGGINVDNVYDKLKTLLDYPSDSRFWIDMESGVRTDDWLDLDKVEEVLAICHICQYHIHQINKS